MYVDSLGTVHQFDTTIQQETADRDEFKRRSELGLTIETPTHRRKTRRSKKKKRI